jgi:hypothetical protein
MVVELRRINWVGHRSAYSFLGIIRRKTDFVSSRLKWEHTTKFGLYWNARARTGFNWFRKVPDPS